MTARESNVFSIHPSFQQGIDAPSPAYIPTTRVLQIARINGLIEALRGNESAVYFLKAARAAL